MSDYSTMETKDLEELKGRLLSQRSNLDNEIEQIVTELKIKRINLNDTTLKLNPYYKDRANVIKVTINDHSSHKYTITRIKPYGKLPGIDQFNSQDTDFLKYYKMCSKIDWDNALEKINNGFKDANIRLEEYEK